MLLEYEYEIYARENRRGNQEWTIQRNYDGTRDVCLDQEVK
jgi:hypothetical protein